jgi:uncharacterized membrane protein (DUF106 family)
MSLLGLPAGIEEILVAAVVTLVVTLIYKFFINHERLKEIKCQQKEKQEKLKELQKTSPEEAKKCMNEMMALSNEQMKMTMKPMFITLILSIVVTLPILQQLFPGAVVKLPFILPYFEGDFGWVAWYFIVSVPLNSIIRRILGVEL